MRKFSGKCFVFKARGDEDKLSTSLELSGEHGFDVSRNKMGPRQNEPAGCMSTRETNHWALTRGADGQQCRSLQCGRDIPLNARKDTTRRRRDNERYNS